MTGDAPMPLIANQDEAKRGRGRPKLSLDPYTSECYRRFQNGTSEPTLGEEATALEAWGRGQAVRLKTEYGLPHPLGQRAIRERLRKRFGPPDSYKLARAWHVHAEEWAASSTPD